MPQSSVQNGQFTKDYFNSELSKMHGMWGDKTFWVGDKPGNAMKALLYVYANTEGLDEDDICSMVSTREEYDMRLAMAIQYGIYKEK